MKLRAFSPETIKSYLYWNKKFLEFVGKTPDQVLEDDVKKFVAAKLADGVDTKSIALIRASLKFFYDDVLGKGIVKLKTPKIPKKLPTVLTKGEVKKLIESAENIKHRLIIELLYSSGLRVSELINLRVGDLELDERIGWVRRGKGKKDRLFLLAEKLIKELREYIDGKESEDYLFSGRNGKMTARNVQKIIKTVARKAKIEKDVHPHTLRHSLATHLLEDGVSIREIQELLGHSNLSTTQIYTHISVEKLKRIKHPLDKM